MRFELLNNLFEIWNWLYGVPRNYGKVSADEGWDGETVRSINAENRSGAMNIGNVIQGTTWL